MSFETINIPALATIIIGFITVILFAWGRIAMEVIAIALLASLIGLFTLMPGTNSPSINSLLAGFANPGLITVMALLVLAEGIVATDVLTNLANNLASIGKSKPLLVTASILLVAAIASSVMNNTPVVVIFIPLLVLLAENSGISASRVLIPLSFAGILGGMTTLVGSSTNLIGAGVAEKLGLPEFGMFDFSVPALAIAIPGIFYVITILPKLMPNQKHLSDSLAKDSRQFIAQIEVEERSELVGAQTVAGRFEELPEHTILLIQRGEHAFVPPYESVTLQVKDIVVVAATRNALEEAISRLGEQFHPHISQGAGFDLSAAGENLEKDSGFLAEVLVVPRSSMVGRNLEQIHFRNFTDCIVLGLQRRSRMFRDRLTDIPLMDGDVLLIQGSEKAISGLRSNTDVILIDWTKTAIPKKNKRRRATLIFLATIGLAASGVVSIAAASIIGAASMIASKALTVSRAVSALDLRIYLTVASMLSLGSALEITGAANMIAKAALSIANDVSPATVLSILFLLVALVTNFITNNASAVLFMPIAVNTAVALGVDPIPFAVAVILAANVSFATPFGYQTNLLVMAPGQYNFNDYLKGGLPLTLISWLSFSIVAPWYYSI